MTINTIQIHLRHIMSGFTLKDNLLGSIDEWNKTLSLILTVPSYKRFFSVTSPYSPIVVPNNSSIAPNNDRNQCHANCKEGEEQGLGKHISGWYLMCEHIFNEVSPGMCRLIHHSNLLLNDGTYVNPTYDNGYNYHIFIRDDKRIFNFDESVGYNDRLMLGDDFLRGKQTSKPIPRNKVLYANKDEFDRDLRFEKFKIYETKEEAYSQVPKSLNQQEQIKWLTLKTNAYIGE